MTYRCFHVLSSFTNIHNWYCFSCCRCVSWDAQKLVCHVSTVFDIDKLSVAVSLSNTNTALSMCHLDPHADAPICYNHSCSVHRQGYSFSAHTLTSSHTEPWHAHKCLTCAPNGLTTPWNSLQREQKYQNISISLSSHPTNQQVKDEMLKCQASRVLSANLFQRKTAPKQYHKKWTEIHLPILNTSQSHKDQKTTDLIIWTNISYFYTIITQTCS